MTATTRKKGRAARLGALDKALGAEVRRLRILQGMTQATLGKAIELTFQQVQKYENGGNTMAPSRWVAICDALQVDAPAMLAKVMSDLKHRRHSTAMAPASREVLILVQAYQGIKSERTREVCRSVVSQIAELAAAG